jgi:DNA polymerase-3 subunit delta'
MGFDSFLGNPQAVAAVREMLASGRVPGALLFAGPEGVGKKTLALMLAKALVCERGGADFCDQCARCRKAEQMFATAREDLARRREIKESARRVEGLVYFDLQIIEPLTKFILTEQIRQLRAVAYTRPFEFPRRIFILDEAQTIHWQAVDLLLKVLEEPPETTSFILICPNAFELRSTIRSRCLRVAFQPVEQTLIQDLLAREKKLTEPQKALAARVAAGSVARARTFDPAEYERRRQPWLDFLEAMARRRAPGAAADWRLLFDSARALAENRDDFEGTLKVGYSLLSDLLHILLEPAADAVVNVDLTARLQGWAPKLTLGGIEKLKGGLDQAYRLQIRNVNPQLGFETLGIDVRLSIEDGFSIDPRQSAIENSADGQRGTSARHPTL